MSDLTFPLFNSLVKLALFSFMLALGLTTNLVQVLSLWQRPALLNRAIFSMTILTPILAILIGVSMSLPEAAKIGLVLVGISPGVSFPLHYLVKIARDHLYTKALQFTVAFLSIITVPLTIAIISELWPEAVRIDPLVVTQQLLVFQLLPLVTGNIIRIVLHRCYSIRIEKNDNFLVIGTTLILYVLLIWTLIQQFNTLLNLGIQSTIAIGLLASVSLCLGHWVGGKETTTRVLLALTLTNHNIALALFIAIANLSNEQVTCVVTCVVTVYAVISIGLELAYCKWNQWRRS